MTYWSCYLLELEFLQVSVHRNQRKMCCLSGQALPLKSLKWSYFFTVSSMTAFEEYAPLYFKQLGFSASQIGFTSLMGLPLLFVPLLGLLGDRFRARKLVLVILLLIIITAYLAPLLPIILPFEKCNEASKRLPPTSVHRNESIYIFRNITQGSKPVNKSDLSVWRFPASPSAYLNLHSTNQNEMEIRKPLNNQHSVAWTSSIFIYIVAIRGTYEILKRSILLMYCVSTMSCLKNEKADYGSIFCWGQIGGIFLLLAVGITASLTKLTYCSTVSYGYYAVFLWSSFAAFMVLPALPWVTFEYLEHRVINWSDVRSVIFECHYLVVLGVATALGSCFSFQQYWEYWYIAELSGGPVIMTIAGLLRRPIVAVTFLCSGFIIRKLGDLQSMALGLFVGAVCLLALSFIQTPWLVFVIDIPLSGSYAVSMSASVVHFSKAGSKASSAVIIGLADGAFCFGKEAGSTCLGALFTVIGPKASLRYYALGFSVVFIFFTAYLIFNGKDLDQYEKLPDIDSDDEN